MDPKKLNVSTNWLKRKTEGLTEEKWKQAKLREEYIEGYRRSVRHHIEASRSLTRMAMM